MRDVARGVQRAPSMRTNKIGLCVALVTASALLCGGCALDWTVTSGAGGGTSTATVQEVTCPLAGTCECPAGAVCAMTCSSSLCDILCNEGATCDITCTGAACNVECKTDATCHLHCSGATCTTSCADALECTCEPATFCP